MSKRNGQRHEVPEGDDDRSPAVARTPEELYEQHDGPPPKRARIRFILAMMSDDRWETGKSAPALAAVWNLHPNTVERDSAYASMMLEDPANLEQARATVASRSLEWADEAADKGKYDSAGRLLEVHAKVAGAIASSPTVNVLVDARGQMRPELRAVLVAACETAAALGLDPRAYRDALAARMAPALPIESVTALPAPAALSAGERARLLVPTLLETWADVDCAADLAPALRLMAGDDE